MSDKKNKETMIRKMIANVNLKFCSINELHLMRNYFD